MFIGKYIIKGLFAQIINGPRFKTEFYDSELQKFIKTILPKTPKLKIYGNKFYFIINTTKEINFYDANYILTTNNAESAGGVNHEIYLYVDKIGQVLAMELENTTSGRTYTVNF